MGDLGGLGCPVNTADVCPPLPHGPLDRSGNGKMNPHHMMDGRDGAKRVNQPRLFATTPALKRGQYNPDAANQLYSAPHTRISRAGGDITETLPREIGLASQADYARLAGLGNAIDMYGVGVGQSTRGSYE